MIDPLVWITIGALAVLALAHFFARQICDRQGHTWGYEWHHETQKRMLRCSTCGRWVE